MTQQMVWKCEQWFGGTVKEQNVFPSEEQAREFVAQGRGNVPGPGVQDRAYADTACVELIRHESCGSDGEFGLVPHRNSQSRAVQFASRRETLDVTK